MSTLTETTFKNWLEKLKKAWIEKNADTAVSLFSENASYHATPFREPMVGKNAIHTYWNDGTNVQEDIKFDYKILAVKDNYGIAHSWGSMIQDGKKEQWDGIFWVTFDDSGTCSAFKEWWVNKE